MYLDSLIVFSRSSGNHISQVKQILSLLQDVVAILELKKSNFLLKESTSLGVSYARDLWRQQNIQKMASKS